MWVNRRLFDLITADNKAQADELVDVKAKNADLAGRATELRAQKAKDDLNIDWLRHRVNALEKMNAVLLAKAANVNVPVPEIVPTRPGTMTMPNFDYMPSFEDVGDVEAARLGLGHDEDGNIVYGRSRSDNGAN